jgi:membrane protease YdiL (CAAX protease family)
MKHTTFAERHPYWNIAILEFVIFFIYLLAGTLAHILQLSNQRMYGIANLGLTMIAIFLLTLKGQWKAIGFRAADKPTDFRYYILPFFPLAINLIPGVEVSSLGHLTEILAITLMVGFVEEVYFRGLMLNPLRARGFWKAAILTSFLFGLTHAMNVLAGKSLAEDAAQILYAMAIGFAYAALVLKKGIIWPLVLAHFLIDFTNFIQKPGYTYPLFWNLFIVLSITAIFTAYGLFLMFQKRGMKVGKLTIEYSGENYERTALR